MKISRSISLLFVFAVLLVTTRCSDEEGITYSLSDVSSRVSGFSNDLTGPGAELTVNGSQLENVNKIFVGTQGVLARNFVSQTESAITFVVPTAVVPNTGDELTEVMLVFPGSERAFKDIKVVPLQAISSFAPMSAAEGEIITLVGVNLDDVTGIKLGDVAATIVSQSETALKFEMPAGAPTGKIKTIGKAGDTNSSTDLISCSATPGTADCATPLNLNSDLELGDGDVFTNWNKLNGGALMTATTVPGEYYRGVRGLKVTRDGTLGSGQWRIQFSAEAIATEVGGKYSVFVWARASANGGAIRVSTNPGGPSDQYTGDQAVTTAWQRLEFKFDAIATTSTRFTLDMNGNNTVATTFFIDDIKIVKN